MYDSPEPSQRFVYHALPKTYTTRVIRLLKGPLSRLVDGEPVTCRIRCEIVVQDVQAAVEKRPYQAVSYVWGHGKRERVMELNGRAFPITATVEDLLLRLRHEHEDGMFWIDAICIDQSNEAEKSEQVAHMREVFRSAHAVIVSLGPHFIDQVRKRDGNERDLAEHRSANMKADQEAIQKGLDLIKAPSFINSMLRMRLSAPDQDNLLKLFNYPWFERVWIIQEAAYAGNLKVVCGEKTYDRVVFANIQFRILSRVRQTPLEEKLKQLEPLLRYLSKHNSGADRPELLTLLQRFREWKATDPRDKVFALVGLSKDTTEADMQYIRPDYRVPAEVVYRRVVFHMIRRYETLSVLTYALQTPAIQPTSDPRHSHPRLRGREFPSWCPDWSAPYLFPREPQLLSLERNQRPAPTFPATAAFAGVESTGTLKVHGACLASIVSASSGDVEVVLTKEVDNHTPWAQYLCTEISRYTNSVDGDIRKTLGRSIQVGDRICLLERFASFVVLRPRNDEYEVIFIDPSRVPVVPARSQSSKGLKSLSEQLSTVLICTDPREWFSTIQSAVKMNEKFVLV